MAKVYVDGRAYQMNGAQNLLHGCLSQGLNLPYFCWHPAMGSVGACRQCAVKQFKDEEDTKGRIVMACMTPATEGARISIADDEAAWFRRSIVEGLMIPHPHDCPVCDEGGECHLQDMTYMTGHDYRRYRFEKRTFRNQDLGPLVNHEMNRCIQCYRCVRYYREYAGGRDLNAFALRNIVFFGRETDGVLENEFSGNLVEVCPTGVFTDKTRRFHYTRKWDLQFAPSICANCGAGCNISAGERYGSLRNIVNRYNHDVNGYFLCDRGRFGYEYVNSPARIRQARLRGQPVNADLALAALKELVEPGAIGIGSPRASLESNFALRDLVGQENFYCGIHDAEYATVRAMLAALVGQTPGGGPLGTADPPVGHRPEADESPDHPHSAPTAASPHSPSLREIETCDAVLILGEDLTNTAPRYALSIRQAARQASFKLAAKLKIPLWMDEGVREAAQGAKSPVFVATPAATRLDEIAARVFRGSPDEIARLGFEIARALDPTSTEVAVPANVAQTLVSAAPGLVPAHGGVLRSPPRKSPGSAGTSSAANDETAWLAGYISEALRNAEKPLVISGASLRTEAIVHAAAAISQALHAAGKPALLAFTVPECNTLGLAMMNPKPLGEACGVSPSGLPPRFRAALGEQPQSAGPEPRQLETVIVLENDLYLRAPEDQVDQLLSNRVIALDFLPNATTEKAELLLPAGPFAESDGTFVSSEGRAQRFFQTYVPAGDIRESWRWLGENKWAKLDDLIAAMASALPQFARIPEAAPPASFRVANEKFAREPHRYSGRTAMYANMTVHEPPPPEDPDSALAFSMEGASTQPPPALIPFFWSPGWNSIQSVNRFQDEIAGVLKGGVPGVRLFDSEGSANGEGRHSVGQVANLRRVANPPIGGSDRGSDEWLLVPLYHIFGSDPLSMASPATASLAPKPYIALNPADASRLAIAEGQEVQAAGARLPVRILPELPPGVAGVPAGLTRAGSLAPLWSTIAP